jgi:predicted Holliday junction resolvase-like endonuclease
MDGLTVAFLIALGFALLFAKMYFSLRASVSDIRRDAIQRSQAVTLGKVTEHLLPFLPDFDFDPRDARFLGSPVDLVVFDGLSNGDVKRIVFLEVKTGRSALNPRERCVREAVQSRQVEWVELRAAVQGV